MKSFLSILFIESFGRIELVISR